MCLKMLFEVLEGTLEDLSKVFKLVLEHFLLKMVDVNEHIHMNVFFPFTVSEEHIIQEAASLLASLSDTILSPLRPSRPLLAPPMHSAPSDPPTSNIMETNEEVQCTCTVCTCTCSMLYKYNTVYIHVYIRVCMYLVQYTVCTFSLYM